MKPTVLLVSFSLPLLSLGCSVPKYQPTQPSYRQAIVRGETQGRLWPLTRLKPEKRRKMRKAACFLNSIGERQPRLMRRAATRSSANWTIAESNHIWRKGSGDGGEVEKSRQPVSRY